jgi:hypothetical protein
MGRMDIKMVREVWKNKEILKTKSSGIYLILISVDSLSQKVLRNGNKYVLGWLTLKTGSGERSLITPPPSAWALVTPILLSHS